MYMGKLSSGVDICISVTDEVKILQTCNISDITDDSKQVSCNVSSLHEGPVTSVHETDRPVLETSAKDYTGACN